MCLICKNLGRASNHPTHKCTYKCYDCGENDHLRENCPKKSIKSAGGGSSKTADTSQSEIVDEIQQHLIREMEAVAKLKEEKKALLKKFDQMDLEIQKLHEKTVELDEENSDLQLEINELKSLLENNKSSVDPILKEENEQLKEMIKVITTLATGNKPQEIAIRAILASLTV